MYRWMDVSMYNDVWITDGRMDVYNIYIYIYRETVCVRARKMKGNNTYVYYLNDLKWYRTVLDILWYTDII